MSKRFPLVGLARCPRCGVEFGMRSGVHTYCTPACRDLYRKPHRATGPRDFTCVGCGYKGPAGRSGPLPRRCEDCKRRWDGRPERLAQKRQYYALHRDGGRL